MKKNSKAQKRDRPGGGPKTTSQTVKFHPNRSCDLLLQDASGGGGWIGGSFKRSEETPESDYRPEGLCS